MIGQQIDQYHIESHIASGGMADVYLATDISLGRQVALKVLQANLSQDDALRTRFQREAETAAQLQHPNIVQIFTIGSTPDQQPYIAMQYIPSGSLQDKLAALNKAGHKLPVAAALQLVRQIASALQMAHAAGIVHRDLKPSNILLRGDGTPVLADLGIAAVETATTRLTQTGTVMGTPSYMSPEQAKGQTVNGRSDIYSLGIILYEMLAGTVPFAGDSPLAVLHQHVYEPLPPLLTHRPNLAPAIYQLVNRCLEKEPENRWQTAVQLQQAIDTILSHSGTLPPVSSTTLEPQTKSALPLLYWLLPLALLLLGGGSYLAWRSQQPGANAPAATLTTTNSPTAISEAPTSKAPTNELQTEATPLPTATLVPTIIPATPTNETPTPAPPTPTPTPVVARWELGRSVNGRSLTITQLGNGPHRFVHIGAIRGSGSKTSELVQLMADQLEANIALLPSQATIYLLPALSPDSSSRYNANGVDLNRNWDTPSWVADAPQPGGTVSGSGGTAPFSEPETAVLSNWLLDLQNDGVTASISLIFYHDHAGVAQAGTVQPGYIQYGIPASPSQELAIALANAAGYSYQASWTGSYQPTGEAIQWATIHGMAAADVELPPSTGVNGMVPGQNETVVTTAVRAILTLAQNQ